MELLNIAIKTCLAAGKVIMNIYDSGEMEVEAKADNSPLTIADQKANEVINTYLSGTGIPVISEENKQLPYEERRNWDTCWIVDPLDGTKEFIKRNGEFTVNIALVTSGKPVLGVIFAPAQNLLYFGQVQKGKAFKVKIGSETDLSELFKKSVEIKPCDWDGPLKVVGSRSHMNEDTLEYVELLKKKYRQDIEIVSRGSSLKFCLVAEGSAHVYPRYAPTMEWDTAAGQAICEAVGLQCRSRESGENLRYNRENLLNSHFLVSNER